jgi:hypothetical protein
MFISNPIADGSDNDYADLSDCWVVLEDIHKKIPSTISENSRAPKEKVQQTRESDNSRLLRKRMKIKGFCNVYYKKYI